MEEAKELTTNQKWYRETYLKSDAWAERRDDFRKSHKNCECCGARRPDVHHLRYDEPARLRDEDLMALCRSCHDLAHWLIDAGVIPMSADRSMVDHSRGTIVRFVQQPQSFADRLQGRPIPAQKPPPPPKPAAAPCKPGLPSGVRDLRKGRLKNVGCLRRVEAEFFGVGWPLTKGWRDVAAKVIAGKMTPKQAAAAMEKIREKSARKAAGKKAIRHHQQVEAGRRGRQAQLESSAVVMLGAQMQAWPKRASKADRCAREAWRAANPLRGELLTIDSKGKRWS